MVLVLVPYYGSSLASTVCVLPSCSLFVSAREHLGHDTYTSVRHAPFLDLVCLFPSTTGHSSSSITFFGCRFCFVDQSCRCSFSYHCIKTRPSLSPKKQNARLQQLFRASLSNDDKKRSFCPSCWTAVDGRRSWCIRRGTDGGCCFHYNKVRN